LRLGDQDHPPARLSPAWWEKKQGWRAGAGDDDWRHVLRILVSTRRRAIRPPAAEQLPSRAHHLILPVSHPTLAAAYDLTVRFLEGMGATLFASASPWPEMTSEEAAINAVKEAIYHLLRERRAGSKHATWVATRLYNVYGFGFATAAEDQGEMLWIGSDGQPVTPQDTAEDPQPEPPPASPVAALVDGAWRHFRRGRLADAQCWAEEAIARPTDAATPGRLPWLLGMIHYYQVDFPATCRLLPEPGPRPNPDDGWWAKNLLTLARACARTGQLDRAQALLARLAAENLSWSYLPVALPAIRGQIALAEGSHKRAEAVLSDARARLASLRAKERERTDQEPGEPLYHDAGALQAACVDTAVLTAALGRPRRALALLKPMTGLFAPLRELLAVDPALEPLLSDPATEAKFAGWLADRRRE
jgi:hypothetical protein